MASSATASRADFEAFFRRNQEKLEAELSALKRERQVEDIHDLIAPEKELNLFHPRYVVVNTLKTTSEECLQRFQDEEWVLIDDVEPDGVDEALPQLYNSFFCDPFFPKCLVFPPGTDLHAHPMCISGEVILMDKASCFPIGALRLRPGETVIDACAAPGNKTTLIAGALNGEGHVFCYERDSRRSALLERRLRMLGVTCAEVVTDNFLQADPEDARFAQVSAILLDPSCSGSGIAGRMDHLTGSSTMDEERLQRLQEMQTQLLLHALRFPARRVVYCTCSERREENEDVVSRVLAEVKDTFKLARVEPRWRGRGIDMSECVRIHKGDHMNGFFVACFKRRKQSKKKKVQVE